MISGSVVSEELRWQDFGMDGRTEGQSDVTPRPAFVFGDAGKNLTKVPSSTKSSSTDIHGSDDTSLGISLSLSKKIPKSS